MHNYLWSNFTNRYVMIYKLFPQYLSCTKLQYSILEEHPVLLILLLKIASKKSVNLKNTFTTIQDGEV